MRDGQTRKLAGRDRQSGFEAFLAHYQAKLVVVSGGATGVELSLDRERLTVGRGPGVDLAFQDTAMSRQHAALEFTQDGFRIQDLGSTNGILLGGKSVQAGELRSGDRFEIGAHTFQLVIEEREEAPDVYEISTG